MPSISAVEVNGHQIWPGANSVTPHADGLWYYMVAIQYQLGPSSWGFMSTSGLIAPRDMAQYGEIVEDILNFARSKAPGQVGSKVVTFFDIKPNALYRDPMVVEQEHAQRERKLAELER